MGQLENDSVSIGQFEEAVMMVIAAKGNELYGVEIAEELEHAWQKDVSLGAIYSSLERLERKKLVLGRWGEPTAERGGRRKRFYSITGEGALALNRLERQRLAIKAIRTVGGIANEV